ncbi:MAG: type II toxin-antitoxin system HicB family antitoxin [Minisyncoccia bacterium]
MKNIIQFTIEKGEDGYYIASAIGHFIVTQGKTFEELLSNIKEATALYMEGENSAEIGLSATPSLLANFEIPQQVYVS